jgi:hypothetical protein
MHFRDCRKPLPFRVHLINVDKPCKDTANRAHIERVQREGGMCLNILCALKTTRLIHTVLSFGHRPVLLGHCGRYYLEKRKSPHTLWVYFTTAGCRQQQQHQCMPWRLVLVVFPDRSGTSLHFRQLTVESPISTTRILVEQN